MFGQVGLDGPHGHHHHGGGHWRGGGGWRGGGWGYGPTYVVEAPQYCLTRTGRVVPCPTAILPIAGLGDTRSSMMRSPTMCFPNAAQKVSAFQAQASGALLTSNMRTPNLGDGTSDFFSSVPMWAWTAGGGLLGGLVIGALVFRKKRR